VRGYPLHGLDRGPAHETAALFICGTRDVKPATGPCAHLFWIFLDAVGRGGAVTGVRARV
jgi:hypothetical protein